MTESNIYKCPECGGEAVDLECPECGGLEDDCETCDGSGIEEGWYECLECSSVYDEAEWVAAQEAQA